MTYPELRPWLVATPFVPFRLTLEDGRQFDIPFAHCVKPESKRGIAMVFTPREDNPRIYLRYTTVGLEAIRAIEPLAAAAQAG